MRDNIATVDSGGLGGASEENPTSAAGPSTRFRVREAAALVGVSDDTLRRWIDRGEVAGLRDDSGRLTVDGVALAAPWGWYGETKVRR